MADNLCPVCSQPAIMRCRCFRCDSRCAAGHEWHWCVEHPGTVVLGMSDHSQPGCTCGAGSQPAEPLVEYAI